jgi:hypothetical protein
LKINLDTPQQFSLNIRYPGWIKEGEMKIAVNGEAVPSHKPSGFLVSVERTWKTGDVVTLELPMHDAEYLPDGSSWASAAWSHCARRHYRYHGSCRVMGRWRPHGTHPERTDVPVDDAPAIVSATRDLCPGSKRQGKATYLYLSDFSIDKYKALELVPFFTIHGHGISFTGP